MEKGSANSAPVLRSAFASCDSGVALRKSQITTERIYNLHKPLVQDPLPSTSVNLHAMFVGIKFKRSISPFYFQSTKNLSSTFKSKKTPLAQAKNRPYIGPSAQLREEMEWPSSCVWDGCSNFETSKDANWDHVQTTFFVRKPCQTMATKRLGKIEKNHKIKETGPSSHFVKI